ncbi:ABC transporter permease [Acetobacterium carbinolicum]|uniref:ABC transporter permease n=1 Tax=Acetobacterium TaxID=33951 RepID=UPI000DBEB7EA|nr:MULTISPECIES: ABC transporter permease [unclassified Acetobacterium]AWW27297.1 ABC transporter permease [Acetobacterium sp. KB-1]MDK2941409.1 peptide/nickel transport system permease protein [Acetobacterium sp.]MDZ5725428.1 ABC transporter permease [Acetobacterium sp. K1/6]
MNSKSILIEKIVKRTLWFLLSMLLLSIVVFYFARLAPGDPLQSYYGDAVESMTSSELDAARERLGLDGSIALQYVKWISNAVQGDFGMSLKYKMPALAVIAPLIGNTLILGGTAYILVFVLATILALFCAMHEDTWIDRIICKVGTAAYYIPSFWLGVVLVLIFSINLGWLPSSGAYDIGKSDDLFNRIQHMILPLTVMILSHLWYYAYMIRNKLLDEIRKEYVLLAKSKGCTKSEIVLKHCFRNVAPTIVSIMAISIPHVLSGTFIAEAVFNYPGIGALSVTSAKYHDYNLLMLIVLITGIMVVSSSIIAQFINEAIDPRMKLTEVSTWQETPQTPLS